MSGKEFTLSSEKIKLGKSEEVRSKRESAQGLRVAAVGMGKFSETSSPNEEGPALLRCPRVESLLCAKA